MNKYTFLENRLIFQNQETGPQSFEQDDFGLSDTVPGNVDDLENQVKEAKDLLNDMEKMTENEAVEAYEKLQSLSAEKIPELKNKIEKDANVPIGLKEKLITKLDELKVYVDNLLEDFYVLGKDEYGLNVAMISNLSDIINSKKAYPDQDWINNFKDLSYDNQKRVLDSVIGELDEMTAGTLIVGDVEERFWRSFAAEHEKQNGNKNYDWENGIEMLISANKEGAKKDLLSDKYLGDDGKPTDEWYGVLAMLNEREKKALVDKLPTDLREEVRTEIYSI